MSKIDAVRAAMVEAMKAKDKARKDSLFHAAVRPQKCGKSTRGSL